MYKSTLNLLLWVTVASSCASIVSKSKYDVRLSSSPDDATVQVFDRDGREIFNGKTPTQVVLKCGSGYFRKATYTVKYTKPGFLSKEVIINADINGWYFGNLVFGGLIGFLIVDPATGAMYKLDRTELNETLATDNKTSANDVRSLEIVDINKIPEALKQRLILLQ
jgi:hypothetical protein